jgi:diguanylate cyclase
VKRIPELRLRAWDWSKLRSTSDDAGLIEHAGGSWASVISWGQRVLVLFVLIDIISTFFRHPGHSYFWDSGLYQSILTVGTMLAFARAFRSVGTERKVWMAYGLALLCVAVYEVTSTVFSIMNVDDNVSFADFINLSFYPFMYVAVTQLMRMQVRQVPRSVWLDGVIGASACAALALVFQYNSIVAGASGGTPLEDGVALAYPVADVLVISLLAGLLPMCGWRPGRVWLFVALGLVTNAVGDFATMHVVNVQPGTPWDIPWDLTFLFLGLAPWRKANVGDKIAIQSWAILTMPVFFALVSLGVVFSGTFRHLPIVTAALAMIGVLGGLIRLGFTFREIRSLSESRRQARTDELTELGNRRFFYERAAALMLNRSPDQPLALLVIDLNKFKEINDTLGHHVGDGLLRQLGPRLHKAIRKDDTIARLGGDEFAVIIDGATEERAIEYAHRILAAVDEPFLLEDVPVRISASVGIALFPDHATEPNGLLQRADVAMYRSKRDQGDPHVYLQEQDEHTRERLRSIHELRRALDQRRLIVHYQPQVNARTGKLVGAEALVRMEHPTRGLVAPDIFLPLAEQAGLMRLLTTQVIEKVLDDRLRWQAAGWQPVQVAVNLSVTNLLDIEFPQWVSQTLAKYGTDPKQITFEVTESTMLSDLSEARHAATNLRKIGAEISLDDYGTGYASLAYLRQFQLNELKLDRTFVANLDQDEIARTFVRSTIEIAHALGLRVVAEGIETREMWRTVASIGADVCQGYFFSKPLPADEFFGRVIAAVNKKNVRAGKA